MHNNAFNLRFVSPNKHYIVLLCYFSDHHCKWDFLLIKKYSILNN